MTESLKEKIEKHLEEGKIYEGTVSKIVEYGGLFQSQLQL